MRGDDPNPFSTCSSDLIYSSVYHMLIYVIFMNNCDYFTLKKEITVIQKLVDNDDFSLDCFSNFSRPQDDPNPFSTCPLAFKPSP